jgi:DNA repair exonuclease SbcCD ATPase subunit
MEGDWLTYEQAAERLNTTPEAVRQKAIRGRWQRTIGNDKKARVRFPDGWPDAVQTGNEQANRRGVRTPFGRASDASLIKALDEHVATLKEQLAAAEGKANEEANALREHNATLKAELDHRGAEIDTLKGQLAGAEGRAAAESAKTAQAIAAFESLAQRLEAMAEARRPWWRRLVG